MSEEGGHESFLLWENQSWGLSNSDNTNSTATSSTEDKFGGKNQLQLQDEITKKNNKRDRGRNGKASIGGEGKGGCESDDHEMHI
ncbi:hypothetical protein REPUB_Repub03eG0084700 [Reevesia pubescens]